MAIKDHSLDQKIIDAAREEFLAYGFQQASTNRIAEKAGLTTGAVYTRYRNKDDLFCSLLQELFREITRRNRVLHQQFNQVLEKNNKNEFLEALRAEMRMYVDILYDWYEPCLLFFCKSEGSSAENLYHDLVDWHVSVAVDFLTRFSGRDMSQAELLIRSQFCFLRLLLQEGYTREKAAEALKFTGIFSEAGWQAILENSRQPF